MTKRHARVFYTMLKYHNKKPTKTVSLILIQIFLVTNLVCPEPSSHHNKDLKHSTNNSLYSLNRAHIPNLWDIRKPFASYSREADAIQVIREMGNGTTMLRNGKLAVGAILLSLFTAYSSLVAGVKPPNETSGVNIPTGPRCENCYEIHNEIKTGPQAYQNIIKYFPSFQQYQSTVLYHPKAGYYSTGKVDFKKDFNTFPTSLSPYFGQMLAEHALQMWAGMRNSGAIKSGEIFTVAEFGPGRSPLAYDFLTFVKNQAISNPDPLWKAFFDQLVYVCYDISPEMRKYQEKKNAKFGQKFEAKEGDASDPAKLIAPGSITGIVLSNELPDAFGVHKIRLTSKGTSEAAFVVPWVRPEWLGLLEKEGLSVKDKNFILRQHIKIRQEANLNTPRCIYLSQSSFEKILIFIAKLPVKKSRAFSKGINFNEIYLPARLVPELAEYLKTHAEEYALVAANSGQDIVLYINPGQDKYIEGIGDILKKDGGGYVITIDYGGTNREISGEAAPGHLRTYGPEGIGSNAYNIPTSEDITADVSFENMSKAGEKVGLTTVFYGHQSSLLAGTSIRLDPKKNPYAKSFLDGRDNFRVLIQQGLRTDPVYKFPSSKAMPLKADINSLGPDMLQKVQAIKEALLRDLSPAFVIEAGEGARLVLPADKQKPPILVLQGLSGTESVGLINNRRTDDSL